MSLPMEIRQNSRQVDKKKAKHRMLPRATPRVWELVRNAVERGVLFTNAFNIEGHGKVWGRAIKSVDMSLHRKTVLQDEDFLFQVRQAMRAHHRELRTHLHDTCNKLIPRMFTLDISSPSDVVKGEHNAQIAGHLLYKDRFLSHPDGYSDYSMRFEAPQLVELLIEHFYGYQQPDPKNQKHRRRQHIKSGWRIQHLIQSINGPFLCLLSTSLYHSLLNWSQGYLDSKKFGGRSQAKTYERHSTMWEALSPADRQMIIKDVRAKVQSHVDNLKESTKQEEISKPTIEAAPVKSYKPLPLPDGEDTLLAPTISIPANPPPKPQETLPSNTLPNLTAPPSISPALRHQGTTVEELSKLVVSEAPIPPGTKKFKSSSSSSERGGEGEHTSLERSFPSPRTTPKPKKTIQDKKSNLAPGRKTKREDARNSKPLLSSKVKGGGEPPKLKMVKNGMGHRWSGRGSTKKKLERRRKARIVSQDRIAGEKVVKRPTFEDELRLRLPRD